MASRWKRNCSIARQVDVFEMLGRWVEIEYLHPFRGVLEIAGDHELAVWAGGRLEYILFVLWNDLNPFILSWAFNIYFDNSVQGSIVIGHEEELRPLIMDIIKRGNPLAHNRLDNELTLQLLVSVAFQISVVNQKLSIIASWYGQKKVGTIVGHVRLNHSLGQVLHLKAKYIFSLFGANSVIVHFLISQLVSFLSLLAMYHLWRVLVLERLGHLETRIEEAFVVLGPRNATELDPAEHVML